MRRALVVGRFQPVHHGHIHVIKQAREHAGSVVVAVGSSKEAGTLRNPFTFEERKRMLHAVLGPDLDVVAVPDIHDPPRWVDHCVSLTGPVDEVFGNDDRTMDLFEDAGYAVHRPGLENRDAWRSTTIRAWLAEEDPSWKQAVPKGVAEVLIDIEASKRLRRMEV